MFLFLQKTPIRETDFVCLLVEGPSTQLRHRAPLEWGLLLRGQTLGVVGIVSAFAVNFTSTGLCWSTL